VKAFEIENNGKKWTIGKPTRTAKEEFETFITQQAWNEIAALREIVPEAFSEAKSEFVRLAGSKEYRAGGKAWMAAFHGPDGDALFLLSLLKEHHPDATLNDARGLMFDKPEDVEAALAVMVPGFFEFVAGLPDTPPAMRRVLLATAQKWAKSPPVPENEPTTISATG